MMELKANDYYQVEAGFALNQEMLETLTLLYQPLIGIEALGFYLTCLAETKKQDRYQNHMRLISLCGLNIDPLEKARIKCEQFQLIRTYMKTNQDKTLYVYALQKPLSVSEFLSHDIFGRYYVKYIGPKQADLTKKKLCSSIIDKSDFLDVSASFENSIMYNWNESNELEFAKIREVSLKEKKYSGNFDMKMFLSEISPLVFPEAARTSTNLELIANLADLYGICVDDMIVYVGRSIILPSNTLSEEKLKSYVRNSKKQISESKSDNPYELAPVAFLKNKNHGIEPTLNEKKILEMLSRDLQMKPEVINVLIEYVLSISDGKIIRGFVESIASTWNRLDVKNLQDALNMVEIQKKQQKKKRNEKEMILPKYYQKKEVHREVQENEMDEEELHQLEEQLRKRG